MNKYFLVFTASTTLFLASCAEAPVEQEEPVPSTVASMPAASAMPDTSATVNTAAVSMPAATTVQSQPAITVPQQQPSIKKAGKVQAGSKASGALNPEHGKPGHRCDIAVGVPLSTPIQAAPQSNVQTGPQPPSPLMPQPTTGKGRLNPAHGEPGHDCKVAVGQPLN